MKNELWKSLFASNTVARPCPFAEVANEDNLRKKAVLSFVLRVAAAWSPTRIEGNLIASKDKVLREIRGPRGGRL